MTPELPVHEIGHIVGDCRGIVGLAQDALDHATDRIVLAGREGLAIIGIGRPRIVPSLDGARVALEKTAIDRGIDMIVEGIEHRLGGAAIGGISRGEGILAERREPLAHLVDARQAHACDILLTRLPERIGAVLNLELRDAVVDVLDCVRGKRRELVVDDHGLGAQRQITFDLLADALECSRVNLARIGFRRLVRRIDSSLALPGGRRHPLRNQPSRLLRRVGDDCAKLIKTPGNIFTRLRQLLFLLVGKLLGANLCRLSGCSPQRRLLALDQRQLSRFLPRTERDS